MIDSRHCFRGLVIGLLLTFALAGCDRSPAPTAAGAPTSGQPSAGMDVAVVTVIAAEFEAMLSHMDRTYPLAAPAGHSNAFAWTGAEIDRPGHDQPLKLVVALAGEAGTTSGTVAVLQTVDAWQPEVLVLAGIAGGLPTAVERGDVLVSTAVWGYEYGAIGAQFQPRLDWLFQSEPTLVRAAIGFAGRWQDGINAEKPDPDVSPRHLAGITGSGNKVIETLESDYVAALFARYPEIASVEMEGAGAFAAANLLREHPKAPAVVMFRGISDIPNPRSGLLGDKKDRERWKRYASDSVAAFTVSFLRDELPDRPEIPARETDVLLITYSESAYETLKLETGATDSAGPDAFAEARIPRQTDEEDLRIVICRFSERSSSHELDSSLARFKPAAVLLVDTALGTGETKTGDVVMGRIVWPFEHGGGAIQARLADARRGSRSLVVAAQAIEGGWASGEYDGVDLKSGTIAGGTRVPKWNDSEAIAAISSLNPRTAMIDDDSILIAGALFQRADRPHFLSVQSAAGIAGSPDTDAEAAGKNAARAAAALLRQRWPYESVGQ